MKNKVIIGSTIVVYLVAASIIIYYYQVNLNNLKAKNEDLRAKLEAKGQFKINTHDIRSAEGVPSDSSGKIEELLEENDRLIQNLEESHRSLLAVQEELDVLLKPFKDDILSSMLKTSVGHDEVLITGGSQTADGKYQYAFVEPYSEILPDGTTTIHLKTRQLSIEPDVIEELGLDSLSTTAGNTLQHGEIWTANELETINDMLAENKGVTLVTAPQITVLPGKKAEIMVGDYRMSTKAGLLSDGSGFDIELRVEQPRVPENMTVNNLGDDAAVF